MSRVTDESDESMPVWRKLLYAAGCLVVAVVLMGPLIFYLTLPASCPEPEKVELADGTYVAEDGELLERYRDVEPYASATDKAIHVDRERRRVVVEFTTSEGRHVEEVWAIEDVSWMTDR